MKVSNELIEVVLNIEIADITDNVIYKESTKELKYYFVDSDGYYEPEIMNIYEFAFKCKEWASKKGYELYSYGKECFLYDTNELYDCSEQLSQWSEWFGSDTEVEAIIKACEWILENK